MPEDRTLAGSRDDLVVDSSRCLKMRFSESRCRQCVDICPHGAVTLDGGLSINPQQCRGCLLCTAVCPVGALEQSSDFSACLAQLSKISEPVLGCLSSKECANGTVACLGGLSEEHLLALDHALTERLTLNLSCCKDCPNNQMVTKLDQRLNNIAEAGLFSSKCRIVIAETTQDIHYRDETVDRRSFFKSISNALFKKAVVMLSATNEKSEQRTEYAGKRVPNRRVLLNSTRSKLSQDLLSRVQKHFDFCVSYENSCTRCQGCVAICPTGALKTEQSDLVPIFDYLLCTGCGLCQEFCLDMALRISSGNR